MLKKIKQLDKKLSMIDDENLREEIIDIFFEILISLGKEEIKSELIRLLESQ